MVNRFVFASCAVALLVHAAGAFAQVPLIMESVTPCSVAPGSHPFTLVVRGSGFTSGSVVNWNGSPLPTHFQTHGKITANILASQVATPATANITVSNAGAGLSNTIYFPVVAPFTTVNLNRTEYPVGNNPIQAVTGDFNHDGKLDAVVANYGDGTLNVMLGKGDGTFNVLPPLALTPLLTDRVISIAIGDFDGDGNDDIAAVSISVAVVLRGNGDGTFTPGPTIDFKFDQFVAAAQLVAGDFNGDGKLDIAISDQQGDRMLILFGDGAGGLSFPVVTRMLTPGHNPQWMAVGDFNGDGKLDIAVVEPLPRDLTIMLGNGDGTFNQSLIPLPAGTSGPTQILAADFNRDGRTDLVIAGGSDLVVFLGKGDGTFRQLPTFGTLAGAISIAVGDFVGGGKLGVAAILNHNLSVFAGNGNGTFQPPQFFQVSNGSVWIAAGDFNNDGRLDLLALDEGADTASIYLQLP